MPIILSPDVVVDVRPPDIPTLQVIAPDLDTVTVSAPTVPMVSVAPPVDSSVTVVPVVGPPGPPGPPGAAGAGTYYVHTQTLAQSVWLVNHNLGRFPIAWSLFDTVGRLCDEYEVENTDINNCRISMDTPTAGVIRLM